MAGGWEVVSEAPVSEWDVVSSEPVRTGAEAIPTADEAAGRGYKAPEPRAADTRGPVRRGIDELHGALEAAATVISTLPTSLVGMGAEAFLGPAAGRKVMEAGTFVPRTPEGQRNVEAIGSATEGLPAFIPAIAPVSGVAASLSRAGMARGAEVAREGVGRGVGRALDVVTPTMVPEKAALAKKAVDAGIPLNVHQLSDNKFARLAGEAAEKVPFSGGKGNAKQRQAAFNSGLARALDPETQATKMTPDVFVELQDKAGQTIGDISARTPVPKDAFGDLAAVARRETPDVQKVIQVYADDFAKVADENGGIIPGDTLRRLRTEAQQQARTTSNGDLRRTLGDFVKKVDDALTEHAAPGDMDALLDARRRYAISKVLEPLVAKSADGDISPAALMARVTSDRAGKQRMARGKGGDMGDYARIGQKFLKEQATSNTAERNLTYRVFTDAVTAMKAATAYPFATAYNMLGPKAAKWMVERQARRNAPAPEVPPRPPAEPTLGRGFEDVPPRGGSGPASPLGDLVPDWETSPGAGRERPPAMSAEGLVPAVGDDVVTTGPRKDLRAGLEIPAVEGRPDLPDTMPVGAPAEAAATPRAIAAMDEPGAIEARRRQTMVEVEAAAAAERAEPVPVGQATEIKPEVVEPAQAPLSDPRLTEIERLKAATQSDTVRAALDKRAAAVKKELKAAQEAEKRAADAAELRSMAEQTTDPGVKKGLLAEADKLSKEEKIPVGEATEIKPEVIEPEVSGEKTKGVSSPRGSVEQAESKGFTVKAYRGVDKSKPFNDSETTWLTTDRDVAEVYAREVMGYDDPDVLEVRVNPTNLKRHDASRLTEEQRAALKADEFGNPQEVGIYERSDDHPLGGSRRNVTVIHAPKDAVFVIDKGVPNATEKVPKQAGLREQPEGGTVGRQAEEAGPGDRVQRAAPGEGAPGEKGTESLSLDLPVLDEVFMAEQQRVQQRAAPPAPVSDRGLKAVRKALTDGMADGTLDKDGASLALWALDRNPNLARGLKQEGLKLEVRKTDEVPAGARGAYNDARELIRLVSGRTDGLTAAHELLHHSERMMPEHMQRGIRREWRRAVEDAIDTAETPERREALRTALRALGDGDASAYSDMRAYFADKTLTRDDYRLVNPTEFWAENASEILHARFTGRGSWRAQAKQWLVELIEHLKGTVGLRSDAPILKALDEILNPKKTTGERKSKNMITGKGRPTSPAQPQAP